MLKDEIKKFQQTLQEAENEEEDSRLDLDKMTEAQLEKRRFNQRSAADRTNSAFQKTQAASEFPHSANPYNATGYGGLSHAGSNLQSGPLAYVPVRKVETEEEKIKRYERLVEKLKQTLNNDRRTLRACRLQYSKELSNRTELEELLKQAVEKVKNERKQHRRNAQ